MDGHLIGTVEGEKVSVVPLAVEVAWQAEEMAVALLRLPEGTTPLTLH